jgi:enoyl-CoA hydratase
VRVIILAGAGKHFSAGPRSRQPAGDGRPEGDAARARLQGEYLRLWERFFENTMRWRDLPKPTIAQVQGYCIMGGMMIASACDLIIASDDALFADRAVKWGGAHVQYFSMPWDLGPRKAKEYLFTGEFIGAAEAEKLGLVNRVVPRARLEEETMKLAQQIAERDPFALKFAKASVNEMQNAQGWREALEGAFKNYMMTIPAPHRDGNLRRRGAREEPEGPLRGAQQEPREEGGLEIHRLPPCAQRGEESLRHPPLRHGERRRGRAFPSQSDLERQRRGRSACVVGVQRPRRPLASTCSLSIT